MESMNSNIQDFESLGYPLQLVSVDSNVNSKFIVHKEGAEFLKSIKDPIGKQNLHSVEPDSASKS
jgi:hypothetical protein